MHQLVVIGNGFDRACDLPSGFDQFYAHRAKELGNLLACPDGCTVWDAILSREKRLGNTRWSDVELHVAEWVRGVGVSKLEMEELPEGVLDVDAEAPMTVFSNPVHAFVRQHWSRHGRPDKSALAKLSLDELHRYEELFMWYLSDQVNLKGDSYLASAERIMKLICLDPGVGIGKELFTSVLSFNYTTPFTMGIRTRCFIDYVCNVHGTLDGANAVFGIDGMGVEADDVAVPFTKTYRILSLDPVGFRRLVHEPDDEDPTVLIKFYGHSLAEADYSYFQSLFDTVDLYGGRTALVFYYSEYKEGVDAKGETHKAVTKLLSTYGKTLDNKDHGKNLMHKLLLEGRLMVRELPR